MIEAAAVVVPAHNEETMLPACLQALQAALSTLSIPVHLLVVADACTDQTTTVARAFGAQVTSIRARSVGAARAAGMAEALRLTAGIRPSSVWLATTDADTAVPAHWLRRQLRYAGQGWDVVLGTVTVTDWDGHPAHVPAAFRAHYAFGQGPHPHVHGANLGIRASAYRAAGGFTSLPTAEDHALLAAATQTGSAVLRAGDITVRTSARRLARAPGGFSHLLRTLAEHQDVAGFTASNGQPLHRESPPAQKRRRPSLSFSSPVMRAKWHQHESPLLSGRPFIEASWRLSGYEPLPDTGQGPR